ncbi:hypothetical protein LTR86_002036 [Recurvomyces mirabilis]|nr:hypothetical protein LTR86_002036 [Recurvomyces mirabilis]
MAERHLIALAMIELMASTFTQEVRRALDLAAQEQIKNTLEFAKTKQELERTRAETRAAEGQAREKLSAVEKVLVEVKADLLEVKEIAKAALEKVETIKSDHKKSNGKKKLLKYRINTLESEQDELKGLVHTLESEQDELKGLVLQHMQPSIQVGIAELRRMMIRKLSGDMKSVPSIPSKNATVSTGPSHMNLDDQWANNLTYAHFRQAGLEHLWEYASFLKDDTLTAARNAFVHKKGMQHWFARALLRAEQENDPTYHEHATKYAAAFQYTHGKSIKDVAAQ